MKKATEFKPLPLRALLLSVLVAISGGVAVGFCMGHEYHKVTHRCPPTHPHPMGYTVLDAEHVVTCENDTVRYPWKRSYQFQNNLPDHDNR